MIYQNAENYVSWIAAIKSGTCSIKAVIRSSTTGLKIALTLALLVVVILYLDNPIRKRSNFRSCFKSILIQFVFFHEIKIRIVIDFSLQWTTSKHWSSGIVFLASIHVEPSIYFNFFAFTFINSSELTLFHGIKDFRGLIRGINPKVLIFFFCILLTYMVIHQLGYPSFSWH